MLSNSPKELTEPPLPVQTEPRIFLEYECATIQSQLLRVSDRKWRRSLRLGVWLLAIVPAVLSIDLLLISLIILFPSIGLLGVVSAGVKVS